MTPGSATLWPIRSPAPATVEAIEAAGSITMLDSATAPTPVAATASISVTHNQRSRSLWRDWRVQLAALLLVGMVVVGSVAVGSGAWASWFSSFASGTAVTTTAATISTPVAPTVSGTAGELVVSWPAATLGATTPITSYTVKRYSGTTAQTISGACAGTVANIGCVEINVPAGTWTYTITPIIAGTTWTGPESAKSAAVTTTGVASNNSLWFWVTP